MWIEAMQTTAVFTVPRIIAVHNMKHIKTPHTPRKFASTWSYTHWQWRVTSTATVNMEFIWKAYSNKPTYLYYSSSASRMIPRDVKVFLFPVRRNKKKDINSRKPTASNYSNINVFSTKMTDW